MVFSRASQPEWEANPELRDHQSFAVTTISSIARAVGSHLGKSRKKKGDTWQKVDRLLPLLTVFCLAALSNLFSS